MVCGVLTTLLVVCASRIIHSILALAQTLILPLHSDSSATGSLYGDTVMERAEEGIEGTVRTDHPVGETPQIVDFPSDDGQRMTVHSKEVVVKTNGGAHTQGSSLIKLRNIVDYSWEHKLYTGQLLAVHMLGDFLAYAVKVVAPGSASSVGMVRVVQRSTERRALLKGMQGLIQDLSFASISQQVLLACIDTSSSFYIYQLHTQTDTIIAEILFSVMGNGGSLAHRIVWCLYVPDEGEEDLQEEDDPKKLLLTTCGSKAYVWYLSRMINKHGIGPHKLQDVMEPNFIVDQHAQDILDATFSPDGSALATASRDGQVKFFQIYGYDDKIKCVHQWTPHGDKPVSSLLFLDSRSALSSDQFWKYVVTGFENVVKMWSCKDWSLLQTITFSGSHLLKLGLSRSAEQLLVSDITKRVLYVLDLTPNTWASCYCTSLTHFYLPFPFLSFADVHVGRKIYKCPSSCTDPYHCSSLEEEENDSPTNRDNLMEDDMVINGAVEDGEGAIRSKKDGCSVSSILHLYLVQPKSLQHASITLPDLQISPSTPPAIPVSPCMNPALQETSTHNSILMDKREESQLSKEEPELSEPQKGLSPQNPLNNILAHQSQQLKNILMRPNNVLPSPASQLLQPPPHPVTLNLMTPDAFSSPPKRDMTEDREAPVEGSTLHTSAPLTPNKVVSDVKYTTSGGSSPSREVQEILSVKGDFFEEDLEDDEEIPCQELSSLNLHANHIVNNTESVNMDGAWPSINMEKINEANQRKANSDANMNKSFGNLIDLNMNVNGEHQSVSYTPINNKMLCDMSTALNTLTVTIREQQKEISLLRSELCDMRHTYGDGSEQVRQVVETALTRHSAAMKQTIDSMMVGRAEAERLQRDSLLSGVSQIIGAHLGEKLASSVAHEARTTLLPALHNILEPIIKALKTDLARSLSTTDRLLAENIEKLVNSKSVMEGLCVSVAQAVGDASRQAFKEAVQASLVPSMERALAQMLKQINTTFTTGVKEYLTSLESCTKKTSEQSGKVEETCNKLNDISTQLHQVLEQQNKQYIANTQSDHILKAHVTKEIQNSISKSLPGLVENQISKIKDVVKEQISVGMSTHVAYLEDSVLHAVRSGAQTPAPSLADTQQQIDQTLHKGDINGAFQMALNAADLRLVVYCCRRVEPSQLFAQTPCPLQQNVLLSLIQQLGADMTSDTKLKHMYLEEAVMNLDKNNPVVKEHMPVVLLQLKRYLSNFVATNHGHELSRNMRVLLMAIESLLRSDSAKPL